MPWVRRGREPAAAAPALALLLRAAPKALSLSGGPALTDECPPLSPSAGRDLHGNQLTGTAHTVLPRTHQDANRTHRAFSTGPLPVKLIGTVMIGGGTFNLVQSDGFGFTLPSDIGDLDSSITRLDLHNCGLIGSLPVSLGNLTTLTSLCVYGREAGCGRGGGRRGRRGSGVCARVCAVGAAWAGACYRGVGPCAAPLSLSVADQR